MDSFGDLFSSYWWLLFPLGFFIAAGWSSYMRYKRTQAKIDLLKTYAASGHEPPADLVASLDASDAESDGDSSGGRGTTTFLVVLFSGLAAIFACAGYSGVFGVGDGPEFYFVAAILAVLALAFLVSGIAAGGKRG